MEASNNAELREAVKAVVDVGYPHNFQKEAPHIRGYCYDITRAIDKCFAALAAPARNCDVGTVTERAERYRKFCRSNTCETCPALDGSCVIKWEEFPYEIEEAK